MNPSQLNWKTAALTLIIALTLTIGTALAEDQSSLPQRGDIEDKYKWKVEDIYPDLATWEADFEKLKAGITEFEQYKGHLSDSPEMLLNCFKLSDRLDIIEGNLYVYAYLKLDEDNRESRYQELGGRISSLYSELVGATAFIEPEILAIDRNVINAFMGKNAELAVYRFHIDDMFRQNEHILSPEEEAILALATPLGRAPINLFQMIDNADHKLGSVLDGDGNQIELTYGRYYKILKGTDRAARKRTSDTVQTSWMKYINTLATNLGASLEKDLFLTKARKYESTLQRKLDGNNIPTSVAKNLVDAVNANIETLHKWTALKKKVLGYDTLHTYDQSVPIAPEYDREFSYEEAMDILNDGLKPLGKDYLKDLKMGLTSGWVDALENEGKGSGAYSWGTYASHPYVLMNYDGTIDNVFTLAHEMGHALNSYRVNKNEPYVYHDYSNFTAEVASTCNEAVLLKYMLTNAKSREEKIFLLDHYIRQIWGTFFVQTMFCEFEMAIHEHVQNGGAVSVDYFRKTYRDIYQKYNGPDLHIGENNDMGGMKIYHFYRTYYVYQYAVSYAASQMLSQKILEGDKQALENYLTFLETGSSVYPVDLLKAAGVDVTSPEPVERTIKLFGELVDEMDKLISEK
ncbi:MAG: oligoendopeptidase F [FCB group bacterium]|nr:oligoendopeptidase F [FCB group bacterium]